MKAKGRKPTLVRTILYNAPEPGTTAMALLPDGRRVPVFVSGVYTEPGTTGVVIEFRSHTPVILPPAVPGEFGAIDSDEMVSRLERSVADEEAGVPRRTSGEVHEDLRRRAGAQPEEVT